MGTYPGKAAPVLLLTLLMLVSMTACGYNSTSTTIWQNQLKSLAGVVKIEAPFTMAC